MAPVGRVRAGMVHDVSVLLMVASDAPQKHDVASVVAVMLVFLVMLTLFSGLIWLAFRTARRGRRTWADDDS